MTPQKHSKILQAMEANMHFHMTYFAKNIPSMECLELPDVTLVKSKNVFDDSFNYALKATFKEECISKRIEEVSNYFGPLPFSWWVFEKEDSLLSSHLLKSSLLIKEKHVGMYCDLEKMAPQLNVSLQIKRVLTKVDLEEFAKIMGLLGLAEDAFRTIFFAAPEKLYADGAPLELYIGFANGKAVTTGMGVFHADVLGIYYITTVPEERKKGYATKMLEYLLTRAKTKGVFVAVLQTSSAGKKLYEGLGFVPLTLVNEYGKISISSIASKDR